MGTKKNILLLIVLVVVLGVSVFVSQHDSYELQYTINGELQTELYHTLDDYTNRQLELENRGIKVYPYHP